MTATPPESARADAKGDFSLILLLAAVTAIGPFTLHLLAPALPQISARFDVPAAWAQPMLSLSLVAMAIANLAWGPLSDRYGRRPVLLCGLALGAAGSALAALAPELWVALLGRLLQAAGGSAGMVLARAVAQDIYGSQRSAAVIGQITAVMVAAPMIAPTLSGLVVEEIGWRGIFWIAAGLCALLVVWTRAGLAETAPAGGASARIGAMLQGFREIGANSAFWRYAGYAACSLAGFYYFVGTTPYVMRDAFGEGPATYGFYFIMLSATYMLTNFLCGPITARLGAERTLIWGAVISFIGPLVSAGLLVMGFHQPIVLFLPGILQSFGAGLAVPNAMAGAVASSPERAGAASGLLGASQFLLAAATTQLGGFLDHSNAFIIPGVMCLMLIAGFVCLFGLGRRV
ncbi:MAG: multidrug effflux MFS transporter [Pseudomonadota bacterium]